MRPFPGIDSRHPDWLPLFVMFLLTVGFFFPVLFLGKAPAINSLRKDEPWRSEKLNLGEGTEEILPTGEPVYHWNRQEAFADDLNRQFIPWGTYCQSRLRSGSWPLWNPHLACGQPMFANHQTGLTNPIILICYFLFSGLSAFTAIFFITFLLSGWGMYAYLRVLGLGRWPSLLAAVSYQFMLGYIPTLDTLIIEKALFPFLLYAIERIVRTPPGKGGTWIFLSIILLALVQTSCHVQEAVFIYYLIVPYCLFVAGAQDSFPRGKVWKTIGRRLIIAFGISIPAFLIGLVQNLPTLEFYLASTRFSGFEEQIVAPSILEEHLSWVQSLMIAFPKLFGDYMKGDMPLEHYLLNYGYVGIVTLLAGLFAGWFRNSQRQVRFWRITSLIFFVSLISNWFYFDILCTLPLFRISLQKPFSPLFFGLIVLAGHGFAFFFNPQPKGTSANKISGNTSLLVFASAISLALLYLWATLLPGDPFTSEHAYVFGQMGIGAGTASLACLVFGIYWRFSNKSKDSHESSGRNFRLTAIAAFAILAVILLDLWPVKAHFNPFVPKSDMYFATPVTDFLQVGLQWNAGDEDGPYRFGRSWKEILPPNTGMMYRLDDFGGYDSNLAGRYAELLTSYDPSIMQGIHYLETPRYRSGFDNNLWDMLGVKYVVAHPGHSGQFEPVERWRTVYIGDLLIVENRFALPRMNLVPSENVIYSDSGEEILNLVKGIDPATQAVCTGVSPEAGNEESGLSDSTDSVSISEYHPERVTANVVCNSRSLLCFYDTWFPGWKVSIDGEPAKLEQVNYAFKGVFVEPGEHEVIFSYKPESVINGLIGTIFGLLLASLISVRLSRALLIS